MSIRIALELNRCLLQWFWDLECLEADVAAEQSELQGSCAAVFLLFPSWRHKCKYAYEVTTLALGPAVVDRQRRTIIHLVLLVACISFGGAASGADTCTDTHLDV
jgi:hypothetical protein